MVLPAWNRRRICWLFHPYYVKGFLAYSDIAFWKLFPYGRWF